MELHLTCPPREQLLMQAETCLPAAAIIESIIDNTLACVSA